MMFHRRSFLASAALVAVAALVPGSAAFAGDDDLENPGVPVTIQVLDTSGLPISTAVVRHPEEADRHRVNTDTGEYTTSVLYMQDGSELVFQKGMELTFEVSAAGYQNMKITYYVRKRKNVVPVVLEKMSLEMTDEEQEDDPVIEFGRDKPIE